MQIGHRKSYELISENKKNEFLPIILFDADRIFLY